MIVHFRQLLRRLRLCALMPSPYRLRGQHVQHPRGGPCATESAKNRSILPDGDLRGNVRPQIGCGDNKNHTKMKLVFTQQNRCERINADVDPRFDMHLFGERIPSGTYSLVYRAILSFVLEVMGREHSMNMPS